MGRSPARGGLSKEAVVAMRLVAAVEHEMLHVRDMKRWYEKEKKRLTIYEGCRYDTPLKCVAMGARRWHATLTSYRIALIETQMEHD